MAFAKPICAQTKGAHQGLRLRGHHSHRRLVFDAAGIGLWLAAARHNHTHVRLVMSVLLRGDAAVKQCDRLEAYVYDLHCAFLDMYPPMCHAEVALDAAHCGVGGKWSSSGAIIFVTTRLYRITLYRDLLSTHTKTNESRYFLKLLHFRNKSN